MATTPVSATGPTVTLPGAPAATPVVLSPAQASAAAAAGHLTLLVGGGGDTRFRVLVDGQDVTGLIGTGADASKGAYQTLDLGAAYAGARTVDIQMVGGTGLVVKQITVGGRAYQAVDAMFNRDWAGTTSFTPGTGREALFWAGDLRFTTTGGGAPAAPALSFTSPVTGVPAVSPPAAGNGLTLTFGVAGKPEFRILVDGQDMTGRITGSALAANGQYQTVTLAGDFSRAKTIDVQLLNALDGASAGQATSLFVKALAVNGQSFGATSSAAAFSRTTDGAAPVFNPGSGTEALFWNGTLRFGLPAVVTAPPPPPVVLPPPPPVGRTLTAGAGQQYATIASALAAAVDGDTIAIKAGTYVDQSLTIAKSVNLVALGGPVIFTETRNIANGKAYLVVNGTVTVDGLTFQGATVADRNGAGIRFESGSLTIRNSSFVGNQNGILTSGDAHAVLTVDRSTFTGNGAGDGYTHAIYAGTIRSLTVTNSAFEGTKVGHDVKSRAATSTITGNTFDDNATASYAIDLPNGGTATILNNLIARAATTRNAAALHYGGEIANPVGALLIAGNVIVNQRAGGILLRNDTARPVTISGNRIYGITTLVTGGAAGLSGNTLAATPPAQLPLPAGYAGNGSPVFAHLLSSFHLAA